MKEYIFQPTIAQDAGVITIADAPTGLTKQNILAIINKTTKGIVHSPLVDGVATVSYAGTELAIILNAGHESIQGNMLIKAYTDDAAGGYDEMIAQFFGLPEALPEIEVATEQEVKDINDDVMGALYGYGKVTVTIHSLMRTGAETTQDLASVIYVDPEKTWAENGFPTLYDDESTAIDTTTNPSEGDEVYLYQITQNS